LAHDQGCAGLWELARQAEFDWKLWALVVSVMKEGHISEAVGRPEEYELGGVISVLHQKCGIQLRDIALLLEIFKQLRVWPFPEAELQGLLPLDDALLERAADRVRQALATFRKRSARENGTGTT
jgi:hypothetical protein